MKKKNEPSTGEKVKAFRKSLGMSQTSFARILGVHWITVNRWERGKHPVSSLAMGALENMKRQIAEGKAKAGKDSHGITRRS